MEARWTYLRCMEIPRILELAWAHAYPGREAAERNPASACRRVHVIKHDGYRLMVRRNAP